MDEKIVEPTTAQVIEQPQVAVNPVQHTNGHKNLILAVIALVVGALIIGGIFMVAYPKETSTETTVTPVATKTLTNVNKTSDLDTANQELNSTNLDQYQTDLSQIPTSF
jgi:aryl-phospho-beta-D-glucosidase BglC (GH1 family)